MQMDDSVVTRMLDTQTQMLQQIQTMQSQQSAQSMSGMPMSMSGSMMPAGAGVPMDPIYAGGVAGPTARSFAGQMWNNYWNYNPMRMSKESQGEYFAQQNRAFQDSAMNAMGVGINGAATLGSFFIPGGMMASMAGGLAVGAAVGGATKYMINEGRLAMNYEDTLRQKSYTFLNPFESHAEHGGIGFSRRENQDIAGFLRNIGPEKFLGDQDIQQVLNGAMDNKLMTSVTDAESFKKKFSGLVDAVKQITLTMNQSIDEATKFMGEMDRMGINTNMMPTFAAQAKVTSSMLGITAGQGGQMMLQATGGIVQGTGINAGGVMNTVNGNMFMSGLMLDRSRAVDPQMAQYIQNNGGAAQVGVQAEQYMRQFINGNASSTFVGLFGGAAEKGQTPGEIVLNDVKLDQMLSGKNSTSDLMQMSRSVRDNLSPSEQFSLTQQAPELFQNYASNPTNQYKLIDAMMRQYKDQAIQNGQKPVDDVTALQMVIGGGVDYSHAKYLNEQRKLALDPQVQQVIAGQSLKEELDSIARSTTPTVPQRIGFGVSALGKSTLGNAGQAASDGFSDVLNSLNDWSAGMSKRDRTGGRPYDLTDAGFAKVFSIDNFTKVNDNLESMQVSHEQFQKDMGRMDDTIARAEAHPGLGPVNYRDGKINIPDIQKLKEQIDKGQNPFGTGVSHFSSGQFSAMMGQMTDGLVGAADLAHLQDRLNSGETLSASERDRMHYLINQGTGKYDGVGGALHKGLDWFNMKIGDANAWALGGTYGNLKGAADNVIGQGDASISKQKLNDWGKELQGQFKQADKDLAAFMVSGKVGSTQYDEVEAAIKSGNMTEVDKLTGGNTQARAMAERYQTLLNDDTKAAQTGTFLKSAEQDTEARAKSLKYAQDFLVKSDVMGKGRAASVFEEVTKVATDALTGLQKGNLSITDMVTDNMKMQAGMKSAIGSLSQESKSQLAHQLVNSSNGTMQLENFYTSANDNTIDTNKVVDGMWKVLESTQSDVTKDLKDKKLIESGKVPTDASNVEFKKTIDGHAQSMSDMIKTFQDEMRMMRQAINGLPVSAPNKTTVSTKP